MKVNPTLPHVYLGLALRNLRRHSWTFGACGVLLMIFHFIRIEYMPALTLPELGLVGGAALLFTVIAAFACIIILIVPGAVYEAWSSSRLIPRQPLPGKYRRYSRFNLKDGKGRACLSCKPPLPQVNLMQARKGTNWVIAGITVAGFLMATATYAAALYTDAPLRDPLLISIFLIGLSGTIASAVASNTPLGFGIRKSGTNWRWWLLIFTWALYCAAIPLALVIFGSVATDVNANDLNLLLSLLWLPFAHILVYLTSRMALAPRANAIFIISIYMIMMMDTTTSALDRVTSKLRLGLIKNQTVLLTIRGCDSLISASIVTECLPAGEDDGLRLVEPVTILTRLGSHVVISKADWTTDTKTLSVPVKSEYVITWFPTPSTRDDQRSAPKFGDKRSSSTH